MLRTTATPLGATSEGVEIVMKGGCALVGSVKDRPRFLGKGPTDVTVYVIGSPLEVDGEDRGRFPPERSVGPGPFRLDGLGAGFVRVELRQKREFATDRSWDPPSDRVLKVFRNVELKEGEVCRDPRLQNIDIEELLKR